MQKSKNALVTTLLTNLPTVNSISMDTRSLSSASTWLVPTVQHQFGSYEMKHSTTFLKPLQGKDFPHFFGSYHDYIGWANIDVHCLVLEYVGEPLDEAEFGGGWDADIL